MPTRNLVSLGYLLLIQLYKYMIAKTATFWNLSLALGASEGFINNSGYLDQM